MASKKTIMKLVDPYTGLMECPVCGSVHQAMIKPASGGIFYRGAWMCINECTKDYLKEKQNSHVN
jgi:hypothetical protein